MTAITIVLCLSTIDGHAREAAPAAANQALESQALALSSADLGLSVVHAASTASRLVYELAACGGAYLSVSQQSGEPVVTVLTECAIPAQECATAVSEADARAAILVPGNGFTEWGYIKKWRPLW
jgi:hypothetical protein